MAGAIAEPTVQLHLSRLCNLACAHCYSSSGPRQREALSIECVRDFLEDAFAEGYRVAAFSGGEPSLYPAFGEAIAHAKNLGMRAIAVTNATRVRDDTLAILERLDFLAISVDGPPQVHNVLRRSATAFSRMKAGVARIAEKAIPFGIAHTVTRDSLRHLGWVAAFAHEHGARALQLHPLGLVGAASQGLPGLDGELLARTYLAALALRARFTGKLAVHVDLFSRERLRAEPELVIPRLRSDTLADAINPLVLMANGDLSPICHGMPRALRLGNIRESRMVSIRNEMCAPIQRLIDHSQALLAEVLAEADDWPYVNWYELLERSATSKFPSTSERLWAA